MVAWLIQLQDKDLSWTSVLILTLEGKALRKILRSEDVVSIASLLRAVTETQLGVPGVEIMPR